MWLVDSTKRTECLLRRSLVMGVVQKAGVKVWEAPSLCFGHVASKGAVASGIQGTYRFWKARCEAVIGGLGERT